MKSQHQYPVRACELVKNNPAVLTPPPRGKDEECTQQYGGPATAVVTGIVGSVPVDSFSLPFVTAARSAGGMRPAAFLDPPEPQVQSLRSGRNHIDRLLLPEACVPWRMAQRNARDGTGVASTLRVPPPYLPRVLSVRHTRLCP